MSSSDNIETKDTKKKRTRKTKSTKSKTKASETKPEPVIETSQPTETTLVQSEATSTISTEEINLAPAKEEITTTAGEKVEAEPVVPQAELPTIEKSLANKITQRFGTKAEIAYIKPNRIRVNVKRDDIKDVALYIRNELNFDHAESVSGVDYPDAKEIEVVYHLGSYTDSELGKQILALATRAPREDNPNPGKDTTRLPSLIDIFYSVGFHERECFEMLGVYFDGNPDNRQLLLPEDWADIPPLRKDFAIKGR